MCSYSAAIKERAWEEGLEQGQTRINNLYQKLKADNRPNDIMKALDDPDYLNQLFQEYGL